MPKVFSDMQTIILEQAFQALKPVIFSTIDGHNQKDFLDLPGKFLHLSLATGLSVGQVKRWFYNRKFQENSKVEGNRRQEVFSNGSSSTDTSTHRKPNGTFNREQSAILEATYLEMEKVFRDEGSQELVPVNKNICHNLAKQTGLKFIQVYRWFYARRRKFRGDTPIMPQTLINLKQIITDYMQNFQEKSIKNELDYSYLLDGIGESSTKSCETQEDGNSDSELECFADWDEQDGESIPPTTVVSVESEAPSPSQIFESISAPKSEFSFGTQNLDTPNLPTPIQFPVSSSKPQTSQYNPVLKVGNLKFTVPKETLTSISSYFYALYMVYERHNSPIIEIPDFQPKLEPKEFEQFLEVIANGEKSITKSNIECLIKLSMHFEIPTLFEKCTTFLNLCKENEISVLEKLRMASLYDLTDVINSCISTMTLDTFKKIRMEYVYQQLNDYIKARLHDHLIYLI